jgi:hypothetical protein
MAKLRYEGLYQVVMHGVNKDKPGCGEQENDKACDMVNMSIQPKISLYIIYLSIRLADN